MNLSVTKFPININSILHLIRQTFNNKSPLRIFHNYFLKKIQIEGKTIDLGSGNHGSYYKFLKLKNANIYFADQNRPKSNKHFQVDLEKKLNFNEQEFDNIILFNVIEHIQNYENLLNETFRILKKNGKMELFVPFMFRYHEDPKDFFRPTHFHITKILERAGFKVETYLIGVGPVKVIAEIILKYFKINFIKIIMLFVLLFIDRFINFFSKDYKNYYCGIHCTCKKI